MQTEILIVLSFIGDLSERSESEVRDLDDPATVQQTVGALQTTVKLQLTFVNIFHSLKKQLIYANLYNWIFWFVFQTLFV